MTHTTVFTLIALAPLALGLCALLITIPIAMVARYRNARERTRIAANPCIEYIDLSQDTSHLHAECVTYIADSTVYDYAHTSTTSLGAL